MSELFSTVKFIIFTKESCGPCGLVKKYFNALKDERINVLCSSFIVSHHEPFMTEW